MNKNHLINIVAISNSVKNLFINKFKVESKKITVLEDSAESLGSKYKDKQSGGVADIGTYSFHATKTITTGEGGMIVTNKNKKFIERLKAFRDHGVKVTRYYHHLPGHNFRITNIQAAIGFAQMENFYKIDTERKGYIDTIVKFLKMLMV